MKGGSVKKKAIEKHFEKLTEQISEYHRRVRGVAERLLDLDREIGDVRLACDALKDRVHDSRDAHRRADAVVKAMDNLQVSLGGRVDRALARIRKLEKK
jgi:uncharacterized coiled-coil DUF342 family protein